MYIFTTNKNLDESYVTMINASDYISALRKYLDLFKKEFLDGIHDKTSWNIYVTNRVLFINIPNSPEFTVAMVYADQPNDTSIEPTVLIDLSEALDYIKEILMHSYLYKYAFVTDTGKFVTGDYQSSTKMTGIEIAKQAFNTERVYPYYSQCGNQKCGGYIRLEYNGRTVDFSGVYQEVS